MKIQFFLLLLFAISISACAPSYRISSDYERDINFSSYRTYQLVEQDNSFPRGANLINKQRINRAINKEMKALGYQESDTPDLQVSWFVKVTNVRDRNIYHTYYGQWRYSEFIEVEEYQEGTLVIDLIDQKNQQVIWHGITTGRIYEDMPDLETKINKAVKDMMKKYARDVHLKMDVAVR